MSNTVTGVCNANDRMDGWAFYFIAVVFYLLLEFSFFISIFFTSRF